MTLKISEDFDIIKDRVLEVYRNKPDELVCYSVFTCWWCILRENTNYIEMNGVRLPCDPTGAVLYQTEIKKFIDAAVAKPDHYGRHGLQAFWAAYNGMIICGSKPVALRGWDGYNNLLDQRSH